MHSASTGQNQINVQAKIAREGIRAVIPPAKTLIGRLKKAKLSCKPAGLYLLSHFALLITTAVTAYAHAVS
ncbi:MAG: hypothetical protein COB71_06450 [Thiotrichales bacterium]|nr:MAG: hypothetical protein COB71_06450 [Thiotrichales bacterium]